jgi:hypothetical protein
MKKWTSFAVLISILAVPQPAVRGQDRTPLYQLACQYQTAVNEFAGIVRQVRGIDRVDEVWVDRLSERVARFRSAAANPRHLNRLFNEWREVQTLHTSVEQRIFGKYTPNHELVLGWDTVTYAYSMFAEEFFYHVENPQHSGSVRKVPASNAWRDRYFRSSQVPVLQPQRTLVVPAASALGR